MSAACWPTATAGLPGWLRQYSCEVPPQLGLAVRNHLSVYSQTQRRGLNPRTVILSRNYGTSCSLKYNQYVGSRTGRPLPASSGARRGKSELRRAVCRITSGTSGSSLMDGECHRKHTATAATPG